MNVRVGVTELLVGIVLAVVAARADVPDPRPHSTEGGEAMAPGEVDALRTLDVVIATRSDRGAVFCALWPSAAGYPVDRRMASHDAKSPPPTAGLASVRFESVSPGDYAMACFHDENDNADLDRNFLGIPSEGTGASNGAFSFFGPPVYEDARFRVSSDGPSALSIRLRY